MSAVGVLLMTMGDPASPGEVAPFLLKLFSDPSIIPAPAPVRYPIAAYITLKKLLPVVSRYRAIGGGSPMNGITKRQAEILEQKLCEGGGEFRVYVANRYCRPSTEEAYAALKRDGVKRLVALPLYPHYSPAITGSSFKALAQMVEMDASPPHVVWIKSISSDARYVEAFSAKALEAMASLDDGGRHEVQVLFSAHSLPRKFIEEGDPYLDEIKNSLELVLGAVRPARFHLCFQSKGRKGMDWLKPETDEVIKKLAVDGQEKILLVPISFVSDNIETLYDVDILYAGLARESGIKKFARAGCMNDDPRFMDALAGIVRDSLAEDAERLV